MVPRLAWSLSTEPYEADSVAFSDAAHTRTEAPMITDLICPIAQALAERRERSRL